jgi:hypothetical protein
MSCDFETLHIRIFEIEDEIIPMVCKFDETYKWN